jgi:magnesium transporter
VVSPTLNHAFNRDPLFAGGMLPFVMRRIGADPATSSAPFVATLVDVTGLIIYFSIALVIMRGVML